MKRLLLTIVAIALGAVLAQAQSLLGNKPANWIEDSLMNVSDYMTKDTTIYASITDYNKQYVYSITKFGESYTFQQVDKIKLFTNYKAITGSMYFFGAWASMVCYSSIKLDKIEHFAAGEIAGGLGYCVAKKLKAKHPIPYGIATAVLAGISKELYDKYSGRGVASVKDAAWTGVGGIFGAFTLKVIIP